MRVDLCRDDAAVAEEALDVADVDAFFQEVGSDRVAEHVRGHSPRERDMLAEVPDQSADELRRGCSPAGVHQQRRSGVPACGPSVDVRLQQVSNLGIGDVDAALAVALACDRDDPGAQVDVFVPERGQLGDSDACGEQQFRRDASGELYEVAVRWRLIEERRHFAARQDTGQPLRQAYADTGAQERILGDVPLILEPSKQRPDGGYVPLGGGFFEVMLGRIRCSPAHQRIG